MVICPPTHTVAASTWSESRMPSSAEAQAAGPAGADASVTVRVYLPCQLGLRFSAKATGPSMASAEREHRPHRLGVELPALFLGHARRPAP